MSILAFCDGSCTNRKMTIGIFIENDKTNEVLVCQSYDIAIDGDCIDGTCNLAELYAIEKTCEILEESLIIDEEEVIIHTDSQLAYNHILGLWKINKDELFYKVKKIQKSLATNKFKLKQIPRSQNQIADGLAAEGGVENPRYISSLDIEKVALDEIATGVAISGELWDTMFTTEIGKANKTLLSGLEREDSQECTAAIMDIQSQIDDLYKFKTTKYFDEQKEEVLLNIREDMIHILEYVNNKAFNKAKRKAYKYDFSKNEEEDDFFSQY